MERFLAVKRDGSESGQSFNSHPTPDFHNCTTVSTTVTHHHFSDEEIIILLILYKGYSRADSNSSPDLFSIILLTINIPQAGSRRVPPAFALVSHPQLGAAFSSAMPLLSLLSQVGISGKKRHDGVLQQDIVRCQHRGKGAGESSTEEECSCASKQIHEAASHPPGIHRESGVHWDDQSRAEMAKPNNLPLLATGRHAWVASSRCNGPWPGWELQAIPSSSPSIKSFLEGESGQTISMSNPLPP